jgi:hypothetical protein
MTKPFFGCAVASALPFVSVVAGVSLPTSDNALAQGADVLAPEVTARMEKEKEARRACKIEIYKAFAATGDGPPLTCTVTKTWPTQEIQASILRNALTWPWGHAQCTSIIDLDRKSITEAASKPAATIKLKKHDVACTLDSKDPKEGKAYSLKLSIEPSVTFENGEAKKVEMGWGAVEAPILAKTAIWSATAVDNGFSVIGNGVVGEINSFLFEKCQHDGVEIKRK